MVQSGITKMETLMQNKELIGASPIDVFTHIVRINPQITKVNLWRYVYKPVQFQEPGQNPIWLTRDELFQGQRLKGLIDGLPEDAQIGVFSKVLLESGEFAHIPMMDFNQDKTEQGLRLVVERLKKARVSRGWVLETGKSYHYYGSQLLTELGWVDFMGTCLLTSVVHSRENIEQVADPRYIGHSLRRGGCVLRITTQASKKFKPEVAAFIE